MQAQPQINPETSLYRLLQAKKYSDVKDYGEKNRILRELLDKSPEEFVIDSTLNSRFSGITHVPTNFKIHVPSNIIPDAIKRQPPMMKSSSNLLWEDVPEQVVLYANAVRATYNKVANALLPGTYAWVNPYDSRVVVEKDGDASISLEKEAIAHDVCQPADNLSEGPPWILVKCARDMLASDFFGPIAKAMMLRPSRFSDAIGGATPLASMLAGGALSAGLGYGAGTIAESLAPSVFEKGRLRKNLAILGGVAGTLPGASLAALGASTWDSPLNPDRNKSSWRAFTTPNVLFGSPKTVSPIKQAAEALAAIQPEITESMQKAADGFTGMGQSISLEPIPVDAFNRLVLNDPFTPTPMQYATLGLINAASNIGGPSRFVSPMDIARVGMGMGAGYVQAAIGGKILGALAGLTPEAQRTLQTAGIVAGAVKSIIPGLFGG